MRRWVGEELAVGLGVLLLARSTVPRLSWARSGLPKKVLTRCFLGGALELGWGKMPGPSEASWVGSAEDLGEEQSRSCAVALLLSDALVPEHTGQALDSTNQGDGVLQTRTVSAES